MVKIRLRRTGSKKKASYRVVVAPSTAPRDGRFIENIGHYHPRQDPPLVVLKEDRIFYWLSVGGQLTDSVKRIFESHGTLERYAQFKDGGVTTDETPAEDLSTEAAVTDEAPVTEAEDLSTEAPIAEVETAEVGESV